MARIKLQLFFLFPSLIAQSIHAWTIDLPDVRSYYFDKGNFDESRYYPSNEHTVHLPKLDTYKNSLAYEKNVVNAEVDNDKRYLESNDRYNNVAEYKPRDNLLYKDESYFNNFDGRSGVNAVAPEHVSTLGGHYAQDYEYQSYMEKKVHEVVRSGSSYLEGLRRSLQQYTKELEGCSNQNIPLNPTSPWRPQIEPQRRGEQIMKTTEQPNTMSGGLPSVTGGQSLNMSGQPLNADGEQASMGGQQLNTGGQSLNCAEATKAREHVRRVAELAMWAIRELQELDFSSKYQQRADDEMEEKVLLLKLAWFLDRLSHLTGFRADISANAGNNDFNGNNTNGNNSNQSLPRVETQVISTKAPPVELSPTYPLKAKAYPNNLPKHIQKRSIQNPLAHFINYYTKYKAWTNSNQGQNFEKFDLENEIKRKPLSKRSVSHEGKLPENPYQDLSYVIKHKPDVRYVKDKLQAQEIETLVRKIQKSHPLKSSNEARKLDKILLKKTPRTRRSLKLERPHIGRYPANPAGDISFYVKNKPGTNYNYDLVQAAQVRAGLQGAFENGNIVVIERYGSNYKGEPNLFLAGFAKSQSDV